MSATQSGDLNKRISIGKANLAMIKGIQTKTFDANTTISTWASVNGVGNDVFWADNNKNNKDIMNFVIRYRTNVTQQMLVKYKDNYYEVVGIDDYMEQHIFITLRTKKVNL